MTQVSAGDGVRHRELGAPRLGRRQPGAELPGDRHAQRCPPQRRRRRPPARLWPASPTGPGSASRSRPVNAVGGGPLVPPASPAPLPSRTPRAQSTGVRTARPRPARSRLTWRQPPLGPYHTPIAQLQREGRPGARTVTTTNAVVKRLSAGTRILVHGRGHQPGATPVRPAPPSTPPPGRRPAVATSPSPAATISSPSPGRRPRCQAAAPL